MDIRMPEMDGIAATKRIRSIHGPKSTIPIIAITADNAEENREICRAAGMKTVSRFAGLSLPDQ